MVSRRIEKWERVLPIKHRDNIVSSQFSDLPKFIPSYVKEDVDMFSLMAHEYAHRWREEKEISKRVILETQDSDFLMRRYVIRGYLAKKKILETKPRFIMKQFRNIGSKIKPVRKSLEMGTDTWDLSSSKLEYSDTWYPEMERTSGTSSGLGELTKDSLQVTRSKKMSSGEGQEEEEEKEGDYEIYDPCMETDETYNITDDTAKKVHFSSKKKPLKQPTLTEEKKKFIIVCSKCKDKLDEFELNVPVKQPKDVISDGDKNIYPTISDIPEECES